MPRSPLPPRSLSPGSSGPHRLLAGIRDTLHRIDEHRTVVALAAILGVLTGLWWVAERAGLWGGATPPPDLVRAAEARLLADERARAGHERAKADAETIRALRSAVEALAAQRGPGVEEALEALAQGERSRAEALFAEVGERRAQEGAAANRDAAEAFRHLGALASLDDTARALAAWRRAAELDPTDSRTWISIARLEQQAGNVAAAGDAARRAQAAAERAASGPDRMVALNTLGDIRLARGERAAAGEAFGQAKRIAEALARKDPGNTLWQRDLIVSNVELAQIAGQASDPAEARRRWTEALRIATELRESGRLAPVDAWMPADLARRLRALAP